MAPTRQAFTAQGAGSALLKTCTQFKGHKLVLRELRHGQRAEALVPGLAAELGHEPCFCTAQLHVLLKWR